MAEPDTVEALVARDRERLNKQRESLIAKRAEIDQQLAKLEVDLYAITQYETAKRLDRVPQEASASASTPTAPRTPGAPRAPRGARREAVLAVVTENPDGLTRGQLLEKMGAKGDKAAEAAITAALVGLKSSNTIAHKDGKYMPL